MSNWELSGVSGTQHGGFPPTLSSPQAFEQNSVNRSLVTNTTSVPQQIYTGDIQSSSLYRNDLGSFLGSLHLEDLQEGFIEAGVRTVDDIARICNDEDAEQIQDLIKKVDLELMDYFKIKKAIKDIKQWNQQQMGNVEDASRHFPSAQVEGGGIQGALVTSRTRPEQTERREGNRAILSDGDVVMKDVSSENINNFYIRGTDFTHDIKKPYIEDYSERAHEEPTACSALNAESHLSLLHGDTNTFGSPPLPPPHYEESPYSVQQALLAEIEELRVPLRTNWDLSAHLDAEYNSHVQEIGKMDYQIDTAQNNHLDLQAEEQEINQKIRKIQHDIAIFHDKLPLKRNEVQNRMAQDVRSRRELLRKLTALVIIQQRSLSLLTHMHACEKRHDDHKEKARKEAGQHWDICNEKFLHLVEDNERLATKRRLADDKSDQLLLKLDELKAKIINLEEVAILGAMERARRFKAKQNQQEKLRQFRAETKVLQQDFDALAREIAIGGSALEKQWDVLKKKHDNFIERIEAHERIADIALNLGDRNLKAINWSSIDLQLIVQTRFRFKSNHSDLKSITFNPSDFQRIDERMSYRFALNGRWDNGDFRCVYHVMDSDGKEFVGKIFILRRGLEKDFYSAERSLKTLLLAEVAVKAFERRLPAALQAVGDYSSWEFSFVASMLVPVRDPMPGSSEAEKGAPKVTYMMIEEKLPTNLYTKYMSGFGVMKDTDDLAVKRVQEVLDAFSHWSWYASGERFMVVDHQGVYEPVGTTHKLGMTDPGIHIVANDLWDALGHHCDGNYRRAGVNEYFSVHKCGSLCKGLGIPSA